MERIAILTHSIANNYGANLQALSTACYLKNHGYRPVLLQWGTYLTSNTLQAQVEQHRSFLVNNGFEMSQPLETNEDFANYIEKEKIKRIVVGSDCVLTYQGNTFPFRLTRHGFQRIKKTEDYEFPNPFWLPFLEKETDVKKCLMSASTGGGSSMKIKEKSIRNAMVEYLSRFNFISVRDSFTARFVSEMLPNRKDITITPDPVFGFNKNVKNIPAEDEIREKYHVEGKYYVISFYHCNWPGQEWADSLMKEAHKNGVKCLSLLMPQGGRNSKFDIDLDLPLNPLDWYALIKYSSGYIGNNMHPIIVALHNNVPFFSYNIHGRSFLHGRIQLIKTSKEYDLLSRFGLEKNLVPQPFLKFIPPKKVVRSLNSFDLNKCMRASETMQEEYNKMMKAIEDVLC